LEIGGKESSVGPGRFAPELKEVIHHHYAGVPSGEMSREIEDETDSDSEDDDTK